MGFGGVCSRLVDAAGFEEARPVEAWVETSRDVAESVNGVDDYCPMLAYKNHQSPAVYTACVVEAVFKFCGEGNEVLFCHALM